MENDDEKELVKIEELSQKLVKLYLINYGFILGITL